LAAVKALRFGVNALYFVPGGGGVETYLRELLSALAEIDQRNRYVVFTSREADPQSVPAAPNFVRVPQPVKATSRPTRLIWEQTGLPVHAATFKLDAMLNPSCTAPLFCVCPQVTVFHDLRYKRHPETFGWLELLGYRFWLAWSPRVSSRLLVDSAAAAADLHDYYPRLDSKVSVVPLGVDPAFYALAERRRPEPFLLSASVLRPHKNVDCLLRAFAIFREAHPDFRLVVCGKHDSHADALLELRSRLNLDAAVDFPGWIPRHALYDLYARAWAFVFPSLFEGFGLPLVEAMAAGIPVACSSIEPLVSIAGGAALHFDPKDVLELASALARVAEDNGLRARLSRAGRRRASEFSWRRSAEATLDALVGSAGHA
jgi:glycosyltransferase involved in cell wall biosynthesis